MDPTQITRAKLAGASGITLRFGLNPKETTQALIDATFGLGMEPVVQVRWCGRAVVTVVACHPSLPIAPMLTRPNE